MKAYYGDIDPRACAWTEELIKAGLIPYGDVRCESVTDLNPDDLKKYTHVHLCNGIAGWAYALRLARWPDSRPAWCVSAPCQPFSCAGKQQATKDERHIWPDIFRLIAACQPPVVIGEQVASAEVVGTEQEAAFVNAVQAGDFALANRLANKTVKSASLHYTRRWLDGISSDLVGQGYTFGAAVLGAHSAAAPHKRQRLYWCATLADSHNKQCQWRLTNRDSGRVHGLANSGSTVAVGNSIVSGLEGHGGDGCDCGQSGWIGTGAAGPATKTGSANLSVADNRSGRREMAVQQCGDGTTPDCTGRETVVLGAGGMPDNPWANYRIVGTRDGKARRVPVKSSLQLLDPRLPDPGVDDGWLQSDGTVWPLATKVKGRTGLLKGFGNAIVPQVGAEFIKACFDL